MGVLTRRVERQIERAKEHTARQVDPADRALAYDVAVITGVGLAMLSVKALRILPAIPFAPGHKLVLLTPLYVVASLLTRGRFGATWTGTTMGVVAFLTGDGRYGVFEVLKHVVPGLLCDLLVPVLTRGGRRPGRLMWAITSGFIALGRYAAIFAVTLSAQPPAMAFAFLLPGLAIHAGFGVLAGFVVPPVIAAFEGSLVKGTSPPPTAKDLPHEQADIG
ncbi:MAG: hypothetical protein IPM79_04015 [Polyangiaceae bacterium]|nr:hypothetical protein [Polyangiaceae bacterium]